MKNSIQATTVRELAKEVLPPSAVVRSFRVAYENLPADEKLVITREAASLKSQTLHLTTEGALEILSALGVFLIERGI